MRDASRPHQKNIRLLIPFTLLMKLPSLCFAHGCLPASFPPGEDGMEDGQPVGFFIS